MTEQATTKWYRTNCWSIRIDEVEVVRETEKCLYTNRHTYNGPREERIQKLSEHTKHFPTRREALEYLIGRTNDGIDRLKRELNNERSTLGQLESQLKAEVAA